MHVLSDQLTNGDACETSGDINAEQDAKNCSRNVKLQYFLQSLLAVNWGIVFGPVFDQYIYVLGHRRNSVVGTVESVSGITSLIVAIPVGLLVDRWPKRRAAILKYSSFLGVSSFVLILVAVVTDSLVLLFVTLIFLGLFQEIVFSASDAVFTDSLPRGDRSAYFTTKSMFQTGFSALGPLLSAIGFAVIGDEWTLPRMRAILISGALLMPAICICLLFFKDPLAAGEANDEDSNGTEDAGNPSVSQRRIACLGAKQVPYIIAVGDFITCIGAGMTVKFFSLFFINDLHFSASDICWLNTAYPLVIALFMKVLQRAAKPCGRAPSSIAFFLASVFCIVTLSQVHNVPILIAIHLIRGGFANCSDPIMRSIMMDYTPSTQRGMWNAIGSLMGATWSGSAFLGGLLSDSHDYRFTFLVTGGVYLAACVMYAPLLCIVPLREKDLAADARQVPDVSLTAVAPEETSS